MRVKMRLRISGTRNGQSWPAVGDTIDLPAAEAADLIAAGFAETEPVEVAADIRPVETAARKTTPKRKPADK